MATTDASDAQDVQAIDDEDVSGHRAAALPEEGDDVNGHKAAALRVLGQGS
jgi:hypothetical protein